jgi:hypothetical protein
MLQTKCCGLVIKRTCFVFGKSRVQISAQRPAIVTEIFVAFLSPYGRESGIVP